jgi:hypothetical protein
MLSSCLINRGVLWCGVMHSQHYRLRQPGCNYFAVDSFTWLVQVLSRTVAASRGRFHDVSVSRARACACDCASACGGGACMWHVLLCSALAPQLVVAGCSQESGECTAARVDCRISFLTPLTRPCTT